MNPTAHHPEIMVEANDSEGTSAPRKPSFPLDDNFSAHIFKHVITAYKD
jgi:hypothetical protein